jgi:uncharacterized cupin superfamily protein
MLGGELLGATVYELDPGERNGPYHYEIGNEECLLVLAGTPTLRHPEGRELLEIGDMVGFPDGPDGAHQLVNESTAVCRVLILSTMREPRGCAYPDSGKLSTVGGIFRSPTQLTNGTASRRADGRRARHSTTSTIPDGASMIGTVLRAASSTPTRGGSGLSVS